MYEAHNPALPTISTSESDLVTTVQKELDYRDIKQLEASVNAKKEEADMTDQALRELEARIRMAEEALVARGLATAKDSQGKSVS